MVFRGLEFSPPHYLPPSKSLFQSLLPAFLFTRKTPTQTKSFHQRSTLGDQTKSLVRPTNLLSLIKTRLWTSNLQH